MRVGTRTRDDPLRYRLAGAAGIAAATLALIVPVTAGAFHPGFSHTAQYISELGAQGARLGQLVSFAGFLPIGVLGVICLVLAFDGLADSRPAAVGVVLAIGFPLAYVLAAVAPCDPGCPATGSPRQALHNLTGVLEYALAPVGLLVLGATMRAKRARRRTANVSLLAGATVLGIFLVLTTAPPHRGLWQRIAEAALFGWLAYVSWQLMVGPRQRARESESCSGIPR